MIENKQEGKMMEKEEKKNGPERLKSGVNRLVDLSLIKRGRW